MGQSVPEQVRVRVRVRVQVRVRVPGRKRVLVNSFLKIKRMPDKKKPRIACPPASPSGKRQCAPPASTGAAERDGLVSQTRAIRLINKIDEIQKISVAAIVLACTLSVRSITA